VRALIGKDLTLKVIEVDERRNRLILSEKAATQELRRQRKARAAAELNVGDILEGVVTHVTGFGLFVDVGVADGLVHRSEITWDKGLERHRGFDPRQRHRVPSSGIPDRGSTSGGSCACPCGGYRRRTAAFVALDTSSLSKCHVRNADSQLMRTYNRNQMTPGPIYL